MTWTSRLWSVKRLVFGSVEASNLNRFVGASTLRRKRLLILCYHGVSIADEHEWDPSLYVSPAHFRRSLELLRETGCTVLPLGEALERCAARTLPPRAVALTFDDGTADFALRAVPILREFGTPATVYLTTYYCDRRMPVPDTAIPYLLWKGRQQGADVKDLECEAEIALSNPSASEKNEFVCRVAEQCGIDYDSFLRSRLFQIMNPDEVKGMPTDLIEVGLHTHRHRTPRDPELFIREIIQNRDRIVELRGTTPTHFCYPSGDYRPDMLPLLREQGVRSATTCVPGYVRATTDPLVAPRFVDTESMPEAALRGWLSGFAALLPRRPRAVLAGSVAHS